MKPGQFSHSRVGHLRSVLFREGMPYAIIGIGLLVIDWAIFVLLSWLGMLVPVANVIGRIVGAVLGFWLNGRYTFARSDRSVLGGQQMVRFLISWIVVTMLSTFAVTMLAGDSWLWLAWLAKPAIDATLAGVGFLASKFWIYR